MGWWQRAKSIGSWVNGYILRPGYHILKGTAFWGFGLGEGLYGGAHPTTELGESKDVNDRLRNAGRTSGSILQGLPLLTGHAAVGDIEGVFRTGQDMIGRL